MNQILSEMDGFEPHESVVVIAATNRPDVLNRALLRPGRFDRKVTLDLPRNDARHRILEEHTGGVPIADDVDLEREKAVEKLLREHRHGLDALAERLLEEETLEGTAIVEVFEQAEAA